MASLAASTAAAASLGVSEMLGNPLSFSAASASSAPSPSPATFKPVAIFGKKPAPKSKPSTVSPINDELAKWYGESQLPYSDLSTLLKTLHSIMFCISHNDEFHFLF